MEVAKPLPLANVKIWIKKTEEMNEQEKIVNDLAERKGKVIVPRTIILEAKEDVLKALFSNFFPVDIDRYHDAKYWDSIIYYGFSPHFDVIEVGTIEPSYDLILDISEDGDAKFSGFEKRE